MPPVRQHLPRPSLVFALLAWPALVLAQDAGSDSREGRGDGRAPEDDACEAGAALGQVQDLYVRPPDGSRGVARDAPILVRYESASDLDAVTAQVGAGSTSCAQLVCLFRDDSASGGDEREPVAGRVERVDGRTLRFTAARRLTPRARHHALIARAGFERLTRTERVFETGDSDDTEPPELWLGDELQIELEELPVECDVPPGTVRVGVAVPQAQDDGDGDSVEILLYLTRAAGLGGPELRARAPNGSGAALTFLLSPEEAADSVCIAVRAVDGVGKLAEYDEEVCFNPQRGGFFQPACGVASPGSGATGSGVRGLLRTGPPVLILLVAMIWGSRRRSVRVQGGP